MKGWATDMSYRPDFGQSDAVYASVQAASLKGWQLVSYTPSGAMMRFGPPPFKKSIGMGFFVINGLLVILTVGFWLIPFAFIWVAVAASDERREQEHQSLPEQILLIEQDGSFHVIQQ